MALSKITADSITSNVITSALIADGQITFADIANNSITGDKLASGVTLTNPVASIANGTVYTTSSVGNILTVQNTTANGYAGIQFLSEPSVGNAGQAAINSFAPQTGDSILAFSTRQTATLSEKVRINASGDVGIGTSSPDSKLHITGNTTSIVAIKITNNNATGVDKYINMFAGGNNTIVYPAAWNNSGVIESAVGDNFVLSAYNGTMLFYTGTSRTERFRIGSSGELGIGGATYGTSGQVLTSGGANAAPTWANTSSSGGSGGTGGNLYLAVNFGGF